MTRAASSNEGPAAELARQLRDDAVDAQRELLEVARDAHGPRAIAEVALDLAHDRGHGVARERDAALHVEAVDRLDEPEARDLVDVVERLLGALVAGRELPRERQEPLHDRLAVDRVTGVYEAEEQPTVGPRAVRVARFGGRCMLHLDCAHGTSSGRDLRTRRESGAPFDRRGVDRSAGGLPGNRREKAKPVASPRRSGALPPCGSEIGRGAVERAGGLLPGASGNAGFMIGSHRRRW